MKTEKIWEEFHTELKRFILKHIPDSSIAEDILQEVFMKIHSKIGTLKADIKLRSWIYQITRNTIIDHYRKRRNTVELPNSLPELENPNDNNDIMDEMTRCVDSFMNKLPDRYNEALVLTEYEGLTQKDMGEKLGLSLSGAKARVQRGREQLKKMLLECCHFEFDRLGKVIDYQPNRDRCSECRHADE
jgi:RNA polymerase sigma-70 factor (ECF subfamily)